MREKVGSATAITCAAFSAVMVACSGGAGPSPRYTGGVGTPLLQQWLEAPTIVLAEIDSVVPTERKIVETPTGPLTLRLHEIRATVEHIVRGSIGERSLLMYHYWYDSGPLPGNLPPASLLPGERRVLFLRPTDGGWRAAEDVTASSILLLSGKHHSLEGRTDLEKIARAIMLPGEGYDEHRFAHSINVETSSRVLAMVGLRATASLLSEVMNVAPPGVAAQACRKLYVLLPFGHPCIDRLLVDDSAPLALRDLARDTKAVYGDRKQTEVREFKGAPDQWIRRWKDNMQRLCYLSKSETEDTSFVLSHIVEHSEDSEIREIARRLRGIRREEKQSHRSL